MSAQAIRMSPSVALFLSATGSAALGDQRQENSLSPRWREDKVQSHSFWKVSLSPLLSANNIPHPWPSEWLTSLLPVSTPRPSARTNLRLNAAQFCSCAEAPRELNVNAITPTHTFTKSRRKPPQVFAPRKIMVTWNWYVRSVRRGRQRQREQSRRFFPSLPSASFH